MQGGVHLLSTRNITLEIGRFSASRRDLTNRCLCGTLIQIQHVDASAVRREFICDRQADATGSAGNYCGLTIQAKSVPVAFRLFQSETPLFQGMKSSCARTSAFVRTSPLATRMTNSKIDSPICSIVLSPETIPPVSMSMMSDMRCARFVLVESLTTGVMGFPVGVPRPVVNRTTFAPAATCAVTHSTSLPGVHCRFSPAFVAYSG